jgi:hypothetical protein
MANAAEDRAIAAPDGVPPEAAEGLNAAAPPTGRPRPGWRYVAEGRRDLRLDLLRGFAVFAMVVDHIGGFSWLHAITGGNRFFVSAAEGFVFISGVTVGIVYGARAARDGLRATTGKLLNRAWTLYSLAVWLALATAFAAALFDLPRGVILSEDPARFIVEVIALRRTFYLVDVMLFYAFAMAVAPLALAAVRRGRGWIVALASWGLWAAYQFWPAALVLPWRIADNPVFNFAPWQVLFFTGLLLGYGRDRLGARLAARRLPAPVREAGLPVLAALVGGLIYVHATNGAIFAPWVPGGDTAAWLDRSFDKSALPFPRLLACAIVFAFLWTLATRCWRPLRRALGPLLLPLGQGALYAYAAHLFVIVAAQVLVLHVWGRGREVGYSTPHAGINALIQIAGVLAVWGLTRARFLGAVVAPLGAPPLTTVALPRLRRPVPCPGDSLAVVALVTLLCLPFLLPGGIVR